MKKQIAVVFFSALAVAAALFPHPCRGNAQNKPAPAQEEESRSFYVGTPVTHPEELSGIWQAPDGHGGAIGLHLMLSTTAPVDATTLVGAEQSWLSLGVGIYQRSGPFIQVGEENYFDDSPRGGSVRYDNHRMTLHAPEFDLDLLHNQRNEWTGRFHRKGFDSQVTLIRPGKRESGKSTWPTGTWKKAGWGTICLHIPETAPGQFMGWSDSLLAWGAAKSSPNVRKPPYSLERYGDLAKVSATEGAGVLIELNVYSPICCSQLVAAIPAKNGTGMIADEGGRKTEWKKMPGDSCIAPDR